MAQPINDRVPIINPDGTPTQFFIRQLQERGITVDGKITAEEAIALINQWAAERDIDVSAPIIGGGSLASDVTIGLATSGVTPGSYTNTNLTVDAFGRITVASNGSGGGGGGLGCFGTVTGSGGNSSSAFATKGRFFTPLYNGSVEGLAFNFLTVSGATYVASVCEMSGTTISSVLAQSTPWVAPSAAQVYHAFTLSAPFISGGRYSVLLTRTDSTTTYALPIAQSAVGTFVWAGCPFTDHAFGTLASVNPSVGEVLNSGTAAASGDVLMSLTP